MFGFIVFILVTIISIIVVSIKHSGEIEAIETSEKTVEEKFNNLTDFKTTKKIAHTRFIFAIDEEAQKVAYIDPQQVKIIPFDQIMKVEFVENSVTVASKSSMRTIGGTIMGGALAGNAGAIVGGLSGDTVMNNNITLVQVKIGLRDINCPSLTITIYDDLRGYNPLSEIWHPIYESHLEYANGIVDSVSAIIDRVDRAEKAQLQPTGNGNQSIADELTKLAKLRDIGILTDNEFEEQKQKLLNK